MRGREMHINWQAEEPRSVLQKPQFRGPRSRNIWARRIRLPDDTHPNRNKPTLEEIKGQPFVNRHTRPYMARNLQL